MAFEPKELRKLHDAGKAIAAAANVGLEQWARGASGVILKDWTANIPVATIHKADMRSRKRTIRDLGFNGGAKNRDATITISAGVRGPLGRVWLRKKGDTGNGWRRTHNSIFQPIWQHYKKGQWIDLMEAIEDVTSGLARAIPAGRSAIGLGRQSVIQIADALGIALESVRGGIGLGGADIGKARAAVASDGKTYRNGFGTYLKAATSFEITMTNRYPRNREAKVAEALDIAIATQTVQFQRNAREKVFESVEKTVKAYPYLTAT